MKRKSKNNLVSQYLENVSRRALEEYQGVIKKYVRKRHGVYALYRKNKLYYVGLASNLRARLRHHLRDRHAERWDSFSVYLTIGGEHLREMEALLLRIIDRKGNKQKGKFGRAEDLRRKFKKDFKEEQNVEFQKMFFGESRKLSKTKESSKEDRENGRKPALSKYISIGFKIRYKYNGQLYVAHVRRNGSIKFSNMSKSLRRLKGKVFTSPSLAAMAIAKRARNGWKCWEFERAPGDWVYLNELRK